MKLSFLKNVSILTLSLIIWSCGGSGTGGSSKAGEEFSEADKSEVASDINKVIQDLPPPSEVPFLLMATGSEYNGTLVNGVENADRYSTEIEKSALNLGVYATDIGYLSSYNKSDDVFSYVEICQRLAETIGIADAIDLVLVTRFESNLENSDSLKVLVNEVMSVTGERLQTIDRVNLAALSLVGSFIEGLYISNLVLETFPEDELPEASRNRILAPLVKIVIDQKTTLADLIKVLEEVPTSESVEEMKTAMNKLKEIYDGDIAKVESEISSNTGGFQLTTGALSTLSAEVKKIRANIIG